MVDTDYKATLFLPRTDFPMKAGLPAREPKLLARWEKIRLWPRLREAAKGREKFILHDGPPYANGPIHIGTAMNKILKDICKCSTGIFNKIYYSGVIRVTKFVATNWILLFC